MYVYRTIHTYMFIHAYIHTSHDMCNVFFFFFGACERCLVCRYFAVSGCPTEYAALVKQWAAKGYPGERDLFICRAVLHTLSYDR